MIHRNRKSRSSLTVNPAVSEAQRRYLNATFGHDWVKEHHFDNKGPLPAVKGKGKGGKGKRRKKVLNSLSSNRLSSRARRVLTNKKAPNPLKTDPSRTLTLRRAFSARIKRQFALLKGRIIKLLVDDDILGKIAANVLGRKPRYTVQLHYKDTPRIPEQYVYDGGDYGLEQAQQIADLHMANPTAHHAKVLKHKYVGTSGKERVVTKELKRDEHGRFTSNAFCPTGEGGGIDPTCGHSLSEATAERIKSKVQQGIPARRGSRPMREGQSYSSDPGDLGRGAYYSTNFKRAATYGEVEKTTVTLFNPKVLSEHDAYDLADQFQTVRLSDEEHERIFKEVGREKVREEVQRQLLRNAQKLTDHLTDQGYDGLVSVRRDGTLEIVDFRSTPPAINSLPSLTKRLPIVLQDKDYACGAAALLSVFKLYGVGPKTEDTAIRALGTSPKDGTSPEAIQELAVRYGLHPDLRVGMSIADLRQLTDQGVPVICAIQSGESAVQRNTDDAGHWVVVTDVDEEFVHFMDPVTGRSSTNLPYFEDNWHDEGLTPDVKYERLGIALFPPDSFTGNAFCPTGEGGGVDPTCSPPTPSITSKKYSYAEEHEFPSGTSVVYRADMDNERPTWSLQFRSYDSEGQQSLHMTGTEGAGAIRIVRSFQGFVGRFIREKSPKRFEFTADKADKSRVKLYDRLSRAFAIEHGYLLARKDLADKVLYKFKVRPVLADNYSPDQPRNHGQFASTGGMGAKLSATLRALKELPKALVSKIKAKAEAKYAKLERRYGPKYAKAIVAATLAAIPIPFGTALPLALTAVAEMHRLASGPRAVANADQWPELTHGQVAAAAEQLKGELQRELKGIVDNANPNHDDQGRFAASPFEGGEYTAARKALKESIDSLREVESGKKPWSFLPKDQHRSVADLDQDDLERLDIHAKSVLGSTLPTKTVETLRRSNKWDEHVSDFINHVLDRYVENLLVIETTHNTGEWQFSSDPAKVEAFQRWLARQMQELLTSQSEEQLWQKYIEDGFKKGAGRAFDDTRQRDLRTRRPDLFTQEHQDSLRDFYAGSKDEFLRSSFAQPESVEKVKLLAGRTYDELEGVTSTMSTRMSRVLTDGLVQGQHPREIAKTLNEEVGLGESRAHTIARTELIRAHAEGQLHSFERLGVAELGVDVEWSTADDSAVCEECAGMEGAIFTIEEAHGLLPAHPNCRCAFMPVVPKKYTGV